nr:MAG TPA: hypothetical protein [Caudoviricetes sp.]
MFFAKVLSPYNPLSPKLHRYPAEQTVGKNWREVRIGGWSTTISDMEN